MSGKGALAAGSRIEGQAGAIEPAARRPRVCVACTTYTDNCTIAAGQLRVIWGFINCQLWGLRRPAFARVPSYSKSPIELARTKNEEAIDRMGLAINNILTVLAFAR